MGTLTFFFEMSSWEKEWAELVKTTHTEQAIWFLNGFWDDVEADKEQIWDMVHLMIEIECGSPKLYGKKKWEEKEGNDLDQFQSHRFLEKFGETLTVKELSAVLKKIDIDTNKRMCMTEYLVYKYKKDGPSVVNSPQGGGDPEEFEAAKKQFNEAQDQLRQAIKLQEELEAAMKALEAEEKSFNDKVAKLEKKVENKRLSATKIGIARSELEQLKSQDPLPLRKAKLTTKAATKKAKKQGGVAKGAIWWMERELEELQKFAPRRKK